MRKIASKTLLVLISITIVFVSCQKDDPKLENITVKTAPLKLNYYESDILDLSGLVISINMDNGNSEDISFADFESEGITCLPTNGSTLTKGNKYVVITHTSSGKSINQSITVSEIEVTSIEIKSECTKKDYYLGENLQLSGLEVTLFMNNGNTEDVALSDFENNGITCDPTNGTKIISELTDVYIEHATSGKNINQAVNMIKLVDIDDNMYLTAKIGNQVWMAENLKTTQYADGTAIQLVESSESWSDLQNTDKAMCYYDNSISNSETYGALYNWAAAMNGATSTNANPSNVQGVCPDGWHLPSDAEWVELTDYLGGTSVAGGKMKETGRAHWIGSHTEVTNESGFTALPGGFRTSSGSFFNARYEGYWWSSTEDSNTTAYGPFLFFSDTKVIFVNPDKTRGKSVRCLKD